MRIAPETFARKRDAERWLALIEAQIERGEWLDPQPGQVQRSREYARVWIMQRTGLRPRTVDLYEVAAGQAHRAVSRQGDRSGRSALSWCGRGGQTCWRPGCFGTVAAKAYRLLRAVLTTAVEEDRILPRNPCRIRGAGSEHAGGASGADRRPGLRARRAGGPSSGGQYPRACGGRLPAAVPAEWRNAHRTGGISDTGRGREGAVGDGRRWPGRCTAMIRVTAPWCCWRPSPACGGARRPRCAAAMWTCGRHRAGPRGFRGAINR